MLSYPTHYHAAPGKAAAERGHQNDVVFLHPITFDAFIESDWDRSRGRIPVHGDVRVDKRLVDVQHVANSVGDSLVCLMRYEQIYVFSFQTSFAKHVP